MSPAARFVCACLLLGSGCAAPNSELNLAPIFARHTLPGWQQAELLGGMVRKEQHPVPRTRAVRPLVWRRQHADGRVESDFLFGFGRTFHDPSRPVTMFRIFPFGWYRTEDRADGVEDDDWALLFWLVGGGTSDDGENYFWIFPFGGHGEDWLSYDEFDFVLWPLWIRNEKQGRTSNHVLWPFFGWQTGTEEGWRVFPIYGTSSVPGKYQNNYVLWPLIHFNHDRLDQENPRHGWLVVLVGGHQEQGDFDAKTVLWPFIRWSSQPSKGYKMWSVWPLIKFQEGGELLGDLQRVAPFWIHYENDHTEYASVLWPFFWWRRDQLIDDGVRNAWYALPLWYHSVSKWPSGEGSSTTRLWPLGSKVRERDGSMRLRILDPGIPEVLDPEVMSRNFGFLYEVWAVREQPAPAPLSRERRAWLGIYRSTEGSGHRRSSWSGLGGRWTEPDGTTHTALLFGLLRWRSGADGRSWEAPAFPGPGWPDLSPLPPDAGTAAVSQP